MQAVRLGLPQRTPTHVSVSPRLYPPVSSSHKHVRRGWAPVVMRNRHYLPLLQFRLFLHAAVRAPTVAIKSWASVHTFASSWKRATGDSFHAGQCGSLEVALRRTPFDNVCGIDVVLCQR